MKPSIWDKLLLVLTALVVMAVGCFSMLLAVRLPGAQDAADALALARQGWGYSILFALAGVVLVLLGVRVLLVFLARSGEKQLQRRSITIRKGEHGTLQVSAEALDTMVREYCRGNASVLSCDPQVLHTPNGTALKLQVSLAPEVNIPETAVALQDGVRTYLETSCGLQLADVDVFIMPQSAAVK